VDNLWKTWGRNKGPWGKLLRCGTRRKELTGFPPSYPQIVENSGTGGFGWFGMQGVVRAPVPEFRKANGQYWRGVDA